MFTWHWGNFRPEASSLWFPLMALHLFTWYHHAGTSHSSVSSPRSLQHGENFTPVQNLPTVSSKRETTTCCGVKSVCRWTGTGSACLMFAILNHTYFIHMKCTLKQRDIKWPSYHVNGIQNQKVILVGNSRRCEFSHVNTPLYTTEIMS